MISTNSLSFVTFAVLLLFEGSVSQLVFHDSPASATVLVNYPTTFRCSAYEPTPPADILWLRDGIIAYSNGRVSINYNSSSGSSDYVISTVSYLDAGDYQCFAVNASDGILASSDVGSLIVQGHPGFAQPLPYMIVPLGGSVTYNCAVLSSPPATVTWTFEYGTTTFSLVSTERITISPPTSLTITNVEMSDEGFYVCSATNSYGRNTTSGRLTIGNPPPQLNLVLSPSSPNPLSLNQGDSLSLSCSVASDSHLSSLQWLKGSTLLETGITRTANSLLLSILSVQFEDGGLYSCRAEDGSGKTDTVSVSVVVNVPPQFTTIPDDILTVENVLVIAEPSCSAVGDPVPSITWLRADGTTIPVEDGTPQFGTLSRSDAGVFACVASNVAGRVRHEFTVTVQGPPAFIISPTNTEASSGQDVVFHCLAVGPPEPKYTWDRRGAEGLPQGAIVSSDGTQLHLFSVSAEEEDTYTCTASNSLGNVTAEGNLNILSRPQILNATTGPVYVVVGSTFSLSCTYSGPPSAVLLWYINGTPLSPSQDPNLTLSPEGSLSVTNSQQRYSGEYVCNVSTSYAFDIARVTVIVGNSPLITVSPPNLDLFPGSTGELPCQFTGTPQPWATWFKTDNTGLRIELTTVGATFTKQAMGLVLHDVVREDSGVYECRVQNGIGSVIQAAGIVRVEGIPLVTGISPVELTAGENISLTCSVDFNYPTGTVSWSRGDGVSLPSDRFTTDSNGDLVVSLVSPEDEADYVCTVSNGYGESSISTFIVVYVNPMINLVSSRVIGIINANLVVPCPVSGRPSPTVQWTLTDGRDATTSSELSIDPVSGELTLFSLKISQEGVLTCTASNLLGTTSAQIELLIRGPAVSSLTVQILSATGASVVWTAPPPNPDTSLQLYELDVGRYGVLSNHTVLQFPLNQLLTSVTSLLPGITYEFVLRGLFADGLLGDNTTVIATTLETVPTGPPQNITVYSRLEALRVDWTQPLESERNGVIISYTVFYRETPFNSSFDPPFVNLTYMRRDELQHSLVIEDLMAMISYDIKILASTVVGNGPESAVLRAIPMTRTTFDPVDFSLVTTVVIAVGAAVLGSLLLVAVVMVICLVSLLGWRRYKKMGKHTPLVEERAFDRQQNKTKSISGPIPGITPKFDQSVDGKFIVHGKNGRVLNLKPKIITEEDVATPPIEGQNVLVVPQKDILVSQRGSGTYDVPTDAVTGGGYSVPHPQSNQPRNGRVMIRPESGIYSQVQDVRTVEVGRVEEEQTDSYEPHDRDVWGREAAEESETNLIDNVPEVVVIQPPSPERQGAMGEVNETDKERLIYASIPSKYKAKKRIQIQKLQEKEEVKFAKQQKKMQEKMEREQKKQETKWRKEEIKLRKKQSREQQQRSSLGLDNVVHLHQLDLSSKKAQAQADFIDSATAALF